MTDEQAQGTGPDPDRNRETGRTRERRRHRVARVEELATDGARVIKEVAGQEIAVFRIDGELYAMANYCVHQAGPLCEGRLTGRTVFDADEEEWHYEDDGSVVRCPWHGWRFDVRTGRSLQSERYAAPTYDVKVIDGDVYVCR